MSDSSQRGAKCELSFTVNGRATTLQVHPMDRLLDVLRHELQLTGTKEGCGEGECGSCSVLLDGALVNSCLVPVLQANGSSITTIEGLTDESSAKTKNPRPSTDEIREGLAGNLCRCTGYMQIVEAVVETSRRGASK